MHFGELRAEIPRSLHTTGNTAAALQHTAPGNVVPLSRSLSDALRLRMAGAQLSRAASRRPDELGELLDALLLPCPEDGPCDLRTSC